MPINSVLPQDCHGYYWPLHFHMHFIVCTFSQWLRLHQIYISIWREIVSLQYWVFQSMSIAYLEEHDYNFKRSGINSASPPKHLVECHISPDKICEVGEYSLHPALCSFCLLLSLHYHQKPRNIMNFFGCQGIHLNQTPHDFCPIKNLMHHLVTQYRTVMSYSKYDHRYITNKHRISEGYNNKLTSLKISWGVANLEGLEKGGSALWLAHIPARNREIAGASSFHGDSRGVSEKVQPLECFPNFRSPDIPLSNASKWTNPESQDGQIYCTHKTWRAVSE